MQTLNLEKVIAHRGASAYAPENTLASFNMALALGSHFIEFDVMLSADGEPFVIHDESLRRTTNGKGEVGQVEADYLSGLDAGSWFSRKFKGENVPHFRDVLKWLNFSGVQANVEIKPYPGQTQETAAAVLSHLNRYWPTEKPMPLVSSFDYEALTFCRNLSPEMPLGFLMHDWDENWHNKAGDLQCVSVHCYRRILNAKRAKEIKNAGYLLLAYTVNRKRQAKKLFGWGVDAVFSDYPDLLA